MRTNILVHFNWHPSLSLKISNSSLSLESSIGLTAIPLSSAALLLLSSSPCSSTPNDTLVSASSLRLGTPGPNSTLLSTAPSSSLFLVADRLPYQNVKPANARKNSTPTATPIPIPNLVPVDKPPCFDVTEFIGPDVGLSELGLDWLEVGLGVAEFELDPLEVGIVVLKVGLDVLESGFDVIKFGTGVAEDKLDVLERLVRVPSEVVGVEGAAAAFGVVLDEVGGTIMGGGEVDEEPETPEGVQSGRVKSAGQFPESQ